METDFSTYRPKNRRARWAVTFGWKGFWFHYLLPTYNKGRGHYISIGLGFVQIYRGY